MSSNMSTSHKHQKCLFLISTLYLIMGINCVVIMKNKNCILYEFDNYISSGTAPIQRFNGTKKIQCMSSCVRNNRCTAFHFRWNDGNCELLEIVEGCMSHDITMGTMFVQLTKCDGTAPWKVMSQTLEKLQWINPHHIGDRELVRIDAERHVARILYQGIYLIGFIRDANNELYVVDMNGKLIHCSPLFVQVLTCAKSSDYSWWAFELGEPLPSSAVVGGYGQDGAPLYVVNIKMNSWKPGYYDARTQQFYVNRRGSRVKAQKVLVEN